LNATSIFDEALGHESFVLAEKRNDDMAALLFSCPEATPGQAIACYIDFRTVPSYAAYFQYCLQNDGLVTFDSFFYFCTSQSFNATTELAVLNNVGCWEPTRCTLTQILEISDPRTNDFLGLYQNALGGGVIDFDCGSEASFSTGFHNILAHRCISSGTRRR
jgi:hypothetical protein